MDVMMFFKEIDRMCRNTGMAGCDDCPLYQERKKTGHACLRFAELFPEKAVPIVEQWSKEHPIVTNAMKFKEVFGITVYEVFGHSTAVKWEHEEYKEPKGE